MDSVDRSLGKVSIGVPSKPCAFTFVPVVQKLPIKSSVTVEEASTALSGEPHKNLTASHEETGETISEGEVFKAVFIKDFGEGGEENITRTTEGKLQLMPALGHVSPSDSSPSVSAQSENTPNHVTSQSDLMETAVDKHGGISHRRCHNAPGRGGEVSSGHFLKRSSVSEDRSSPSNSADLFPTPASSRESILSECEDRDKFWWGAGLSSVTSPVSLSRAVSPCSSVRSGVFTPSVVQVKRHFLAPGSSLVNIPQTCMSSCESLSVPQSPPPRHRPPLTRLSLLTAILRKGRLPVLSSSLQRPYTPCWPVNPVTLSFCNACSAASSVASIPLEFSSRFSSTASIDSQSQIYREPSRCTTATPVHHSSTCEEQVKSCHLNSIPKWEQVVSPPPERSLKPLKNNTRPQAPPPLFLSQYKSVSPPDREEIFHCTSPVKVEHSYVSISKPKSPELKPSTTHMSLKGHVGNKINTPISMSPQPITEEDTCVPQKWTRLPHSSFSKLQSLSQKLRSPSSCPPHIHSSQPRSPSITVIPAHTNAPSPLPPSQNATGKYESERDRPSKKSLSSHCLSPSRYTPIVFPGWPSPTTSPSPTPSPAPPIRDLAPSPSLSLRSTPSPRPGSGISDCSDREGKKRKPHKIKSSYKSLAAIPTNTLLLDQQAIDEQIERGEGPCDGLDGGVTSHSLVADTHAEMCSPAQLRQQSEELYAVIDEILGKTIPSQSPQTSRASTINTGVQSNSTFPRSYGRETKYASLCSLSPSTSVDRKVKDSKKTKPGVIRPKTAIPRLTVESEEKIHGNPFRPSSIKQTLPDNTKGICASLEEILQDFTARSKGQTLSAEGKPAAFSACALQITESEDQISLPLKDGSRLLPPTSFTPAGGKMEAFETHI